MGAAGSSDCSALILTFLFGEPGADIYIVCEQSFTAIASACTTQTISQSDGC
jgi:hypothetical protein